MESKCLLKGKKKKHFFKDKEETYVMSNKEPIYSQPSTGVIVVKIKKIPTLKKFILKYRKFENKKDPLEATFMKLLEYEVEVLKKVKEINYPNIIKYKTNGLMKIVSRGHITPIFAIIMEHFEKCNSLGYVLRRYDKLNIDLTIERSIAIFKEIVKCCTICFEKGIMHGDIKPDNILINRDFKIKLIDFGCSTMFGKTNISLGVIEARRCYRPVEFSRGKIKHTEYSEIFSLGICFTQLLEQSGQFPKGVDGPWRTKQTSFQ